MSLLRVCLWRESGGGGGVGGGGGEGGTEGRVTIRSLKKGISDLHTAKCFSFFTPYCIKCYCRLKISQCVGKYLNEYQSFARLQSFPPRPLK